MVAKRRGKRKSSSKGFLFEVSDGDVSPDNSGSDCNEPESKVLKTDSKFVASVVSALSNLENEVKLEENKSLEVDNKIKDTLPLQEMQVDAPGISRNVAENIDNKILTFNIPDTSVVEPQDKEVKNDFEEGEIAVEEKDTSEQTIQITFSNEETSNIYKPKFLKFLSSLIELGVVKEDTLSLTLKVELNDWVVVDETSFLDNSVQSLKPTENVEISPTIDKTTSKKKKRKKTKKEKQMFVLDTTPSQHESTGCAKYLSKFQIDINDSNDEDEIKASNQTCFNCDKDHPLRDCPYPKDYVKINMMRQKIKKLRQTSRYHLEEDQKYAHLAPGKISDKLREALNLKKVQLPPYIYQMREYGYPPGWLEEAKFVYSNLSLFDSEGKNVQPQNKKKNQGLDVSKIVNYPGFNVDMDKNFKDEYRQYGVPPFSDRYKKEAMIDYFEKEYMNQQDDFEIYDMDLDANDDNEQTSKSQKSFLTSTIKDLDKDVPSPSLIDLETQKQNLLAALEDNSSSNLKSEENTNDASILESHEKEPSPPSTECADLDNEPLPSADDALSKIFTNCKESSTSIIIDEDNSMIETSTKAVLNSTFGTPVLKSSSPYSRLPNPDNFMKDVSPVIYFENLPNSTGKYEQMTGLLQKVRNVMKKCDNS